MKSKKIQFIYLLAISVVTFIVFTSSSGGITGQSVTGCSGAGCHTINTATDFTLTGIPASGWVSGTTYPLTLTVTNPNPTQVAAGFDLTVSTGTLAGGAGMFVTGTMEIGHNTPKNMVAGSASWTFNWTAPASGTILTVNVAGNAVNLSGNSNGDQCDTDVFNFNSAAAAAAPTVSGVSATGISTTGATINANINANNDNASTTIQYGLTASYGQNAATVPAVVTGNTPTPVSATLSGLTPGTIYHYRVVSSNAIGTTNDIDRIFTTLPSSVSSIEKTGIEIYPNPTSDNLYYQNKTNSANVLFSVVALNGSVQNIPILKTGNGTYKIQTASLSAGNYILLMELEGKKYYHTFSK